jgi:hypothetical protein
VVDQNTPRALRMYPACFFLDRSCFLAMTRHGGMALAPSAPVFLRRHAGGATKCSPETGLRREAGIERYLYKRQFATNLPEVERRTTPPDSSSCHNSFSASSRKSSGTERENPNTTDPYPTVSHPNRSRIMSTARSAVQRAIPLLAPGLRFSSSSPSGSSSCSFHCFSR